MIKSISMGIGVFLVILGLMLHTVESYTVRPKNRQAATAFDPAPVAKVVEVDPWRPWAYFGAGVVLCLWTCTLPAKINGKK